MITIEPVCRQQDIDQVAQLADEIWHEHFTPIIGTNQVEYMLERFQSPLAISSQLASGWEYFLASREDEAMGYAGLVADVPQRKLKLSKLYVRHAGRGKGVGKQLFDHIISHYGYDSFDVLWLTVNRNNHSAISWYQRQGFTIADTIKQDIGKGFFMDDYIMELRF